jgi:hypothetical protein
MANNMFTYNPYTGLKAGVQLVIGQPIPNNSGKIAPPHLRCGDGFIAVNTRWSNPAIENGRLMAALLTKIEPYGKKPFNIFDQPTAGEKDTFILLDPSVPKGMKPRFDANTINAWSGIMGESIQVLMVDPMTGQAFVRCMGFADVEFYLPDGVVHKLYIESGKVEIAKLLPKEMAQLRVEQYESQIEQLDSDNEQHMRKYHGILAGALRLVRAVKDADAREVMVDFLVDHQAHMTTALRADVRNALLAVRHPASSNFLEGYDGANVVILPNQQVAASRTERYRRRAARAEADRALRAEMRGGSNGGTKKHKK